MTALPSDTPSPSAVLLVSTANAVPLIHLHLESRRRFYPDVPLIVHDTGGAADEQMRDLCAAYGALIFSPSEYIGRHGADLAAALLAVQSAQEMGRDLAVLMSDAFIPLTNWLPQIQHLASTMQYATYGGRCGATETGLRPECIAFHAQTWFTNAVQQLERGAAADWSSPAAVGEYLHDLSRDIHRASQSLANIAYERLYPSAPGNDAFGPWPWPGADDSRQKPSMLWRGADTPLDYHRLATAYGLDYQRGHFLPADFSLTDRIADLMLPVEPVRALAVQPTVRMQTGLYEARVVSHDVGDFKAITGANVLMYFPHGFGDWVQFAAVLPLLEPSNRYFMTRFGDDSTSLIEGSSAAMPLYCGHNSPHCNDGGLFGNRHMGLEYADVDGTVKALRMPLSLQRQCRQWNIDVIYWTNFLDPWGGLSPPYHTKARRQLQHIVPERLLAGLDLSQPLKNPISFECSSWLMRWVEARLATCGGFGERKLCLIARNGYTTIGKNWGHLYRDEVPGQMLREGQECLDFMRLMLQKDPRWMFLVMEDKLFTGDDTVRSEGLNAYSYVELFGAVGGQTPPFGLVMKALVNLASLSVGIPSGPYHLSMIKDGLPTIGLWTQQLPSWYDEPKADSLHLIGREVRATGTDRRPGSDLERGGRQFRARWLETFRIPGEDVFHAAEALLS